MLTPVTFIAPLTTIRRTRLLAIPGEVTVRKGQAVRPTEVVATAHSAPRHYMLNVARGLGITEEQTEQYIERFLGNEIHEGDIIASRGKIGKRIVRAPVDGTIVFVAGGQVLIRLTTEPTELKAGYPGTVAELIHERGVIISATGALIQGLWGNGKINAGPLSVLATTPTHELTPGELNESLKGAVIMAGHCKQANVLKAANETRLRGLILASLAPELIPLATAAPFPILVTEGFGALPYNAVTFKLLSSNQKRNVTINAEAFDRLKDTRPEIFIAVEAASLSDSDMPPEAALLAPEQRVRMTRAPYQGQIGRLKALLPGLTIFPNGLRAPAARVQFDQENSAQGSEAVVPLANLEILF
ncbi:MAG: hypothetical protein HUU38_14745 [Anaerolineales bacterium]|nr:hypothetical protein [Anaerolineales bacterium]